MKNEYDEVVKLRNPPYGKPNGVGTWSSPGEYLNKVINNSMGYHDFERTFERKLEKRILFLGDSFVEALQVPRKDIFYNQVAKIFKEKEQNIECMGMGRSGEGPLSYYHSYLSDGVQFDPDVIVATVFVVNDLENDYYPYSHKRNYLPKYALT